MIYAVMLCAVASLATGAGGVLVALWPHISVRTLSFFQGFAAGVMITISFANMLPEAYTSFAETYTPLQAAAVSAALFAAGWGISLVLEHIAMSGSKFKEKQNVDMYRMSIITTAVIVLHNLPEGMLTGVAGFTDRQLGLRMAFAVALHNIPEGMAVAISSLCITSSKPKVVLHSFAAGLAELAGGVAALVVMHNFITPQMLNCVLGIISGIMMQISLCQLIPAGVKIHSYSTVLAGTIAGFATISLGLLMI